MKMKITINSVELGDSDWHLLFKGHVPICNNYEYTFDYTGTNVETSATMTDKQKERLRKELRKDFGYAPFNIDKAMAILDEGKEYFIVQ